MKKKRPVSVCIGLPVMADRRGTSIFHSLNRCAIAEYAMVSGDWLFDDR